MEKISQQIKQAITTKTQLKIASSNIDNRANIIDMSTYNQVVDYYPEELVITVQAGLKPEDLSAILAANRQALGFGTIKSKTTIGAVYAQAGQLLRDFVLGIKIIDGEGDKLSFGGQMMKNVAGYDVSRLLVGSAGKLAVIAEISFKVLPQNYVQQTPLPTSKPVAYHPQRHQIEQGLKRVFDPHNIFI